MRKFRLFIVLILSLFAHHISGKGHIVYLCYDSEYVRLKTISHVLGEWLEDGDLYLYIQDIDNHFNHITSSSELDNQLLKLVGYSMKNVFPHGRDIHRMNNDLCEVLNEYVGEDLSIKGTKDEYYYIDIILPYKTFKNKKDLDLIKRFFAVNKLDQRLEIRCWSTESDIINFQNINE